MQIIRLRLLVAAMLALAGCRPAPPATVAPLAAPSPSHAALAPLELPVAGYSLLGDTLRPLRLDSAVRARFEQQLATAVADVELRPDDPDALIWLGRRTAYLGRYQDAVAIFTAGVQRHPADARMYRHRGHRYITVRELDKAVADLEHAGLLVEGKPDRVEPDGLPNERGVPTSTLQSNIWYHLALAHYLRGDFSSALPAWRRALGVSTNADMQVATSHWLYLTLRRLGHADSARAVLEPIHAGMDVIENGSYHRLLLLYRGGLPADSLLAPGSGAAGTPSDLAAAYGVGAWHLVEGRNAEAEAIFERILAGGQWPAFGYIAAEAEIHRMRGGADQD